MVSDKAKDYAGAMGKSKLIAAWCATAALVFGAVEASATPLYRWVDANGVVHYSDTPVQGAERIEIATTRPSANTKPLPDYAPSSTTGRPSPGVVYTRLEITSPPDGSTFSNIHTLGLHADLEPALSPAHVLQFVMDGQPLPANGLATTAEITRGEHTVVATVLDEAGQTLISSAPVTFTVHQTSIASPPRGPLLQTNPKP
jgi:hypothetical protein